MKRSYVALICTLPLFLLAPVGRALAHDKWIEAEPFLSPAPQTTKLYLFTGEALQQAELGPLRRASSVQRFQLITAANRRELRGELREDQQPIAVLRPQAIGPGTSVVVLDTAPIDIWLTAEKFQHYLFEERLIDVLALRASRGQEDMPGRERYSRSLKAIVQVGERLDDIVLRPIGQDLEIIPASHPYGLRPGGTLSVQVLFRGRALPGRAVTFANRLHSNVAIKIVRTDANGRASVAIERPGDWLVALVHMETSTEPEADWRSYWSSLTFALPTTPAAQTPAAQTPAAQK